MLKPFLKCEFHIGKDDDQKKTQRNSDYFRMPKQFIWNDCNGMW